MESPLLPSPPADYGYLVPLLVGLLSLGLLVIGYGVRQYIGYRDTREAEDHKYRDEQVARQEAHWKAESEARNAFRAAFEQRSIADFAELESTARANHSEIRNILESQQKQISEMRARIDRLDWESLHKNPPREGA